MTEETETTNGTPTPEPTAPAQPAQPEKTFTQAELNQILTDRLKREREKHADYDQLKAAADKLKQIEESQLSEQDKLKKQLDELKTRAERAEQVARVKAMEVAATAAAARLGFYDPGIVIRLIDSGLVEFDDHGDPKNVAELVKALADEHKYLIKQAGQGLEPFNPAGGGGPLRETDQQRRQRLQSGGGTSFFDERNATQHGGGVVWPKPKPET